MVFVIEPFTIMWSMLYPTYWEELNLEDSMAIMKAVALIEISILWIGTFIVHCFYSSLGMPLHPMQDVMLVVG